MLVNYPGLFTSDFYEKVDIETERFSRSEHIIIKDDEITISPLLEYLSEEWFDYGMEKNIQCKISGDWRLSGERCVDFIYNPRNIFRTFNEMVKFILTNVHFYQVKFSSIDRDMIKVVSSFDDILSSHDSDNEYDY